MQIEYIIVIHHWQLVRHAAALTVLQHEGEVEPMA